MRVSGPDNRWEAGSDFHFWHPTTPPGNANPWNKDCRFLGSGRDAFATLLRWGRRVQNWDNLFVPTYFCPEVVEFLRDEIDVRFYADHPFEPLRIPSGTKPTDLVLVNNTFGVRVAADPNKGAVIVEDHSHDPWSSWAFNSKADYCLASLRKTLPVPDGAVLWSPTGGSLPDQPAVTAKRSRAAQAKLSGMVGKSIYLSGGPIEKAEFRAELLSGEGDIALGDPSGMSAVARAVVASAPIAEWRARKAQNYRWLANRLRGRARGYEPRDFREGIVPLSLVLQADSRPLRDHMRAGLIERRIYPAVLWDLEKGTDPRAQALSETILNIHCDMRYDSSDLEKIAVAIEHIAEEGV